MIRRMMNATDLIRALRALGMSQNDIASRADLNQSSVSRWEAGEAPKGADAALKLQALYEQVRTQGSASAAAGQGQAA